MHFEGSQKYRFQYYAIVLLPATRGVRTVKEIKFLPNISNKFSKHSKERKRVEGMDRLCLKSTYFKPHWSDLALPAKSTQLSETCCDINLAQSRKNRGYSRQFLKAKQWLIIKEECWRWEVRYNNQNKMLPCKPISKEYKADSANTWRRGRGLMWPPCRSRLFPQNPLWSLTNFSEKRKERSSFYAGRFSKNGRERRSRERKRWTKSPFYTLITEPRKIQRVKAIRKPQI